MMNYQRTPIGLPSFHSLTKVLLISTIICLCLIPNYDAGILDKTGCFKRRYKYYANKTIETNGIRLPCEGYIPVMSCWGRCVSYELGDYKIPYKISKHPVCTYKGRVQRTVRIPGCHPAHTDPTMTVFDARLCACAECDSETTSCENLKG